VHSPLQSPVQSPLQSAPAKEEDLQFTNPVGSLKVQSLVSRMSEEVQTERVSQMGFRLLSLPVLGVGGKRERERIGERTRDRERRRE